MYKIYRCIRPTKCAKGIKKDKTDRKYLSQYNFYNRGRNQLLARDLSLW